MKKLLKLIIADDERRVRMLIKGLIQFQELGLELIAEASDGLEALALCKKQIPDILVTDINMPGLSGLELIKELKQHLPTIKIIIVSGYSEFEYAKTAIRFGVYDYIIKPIDEAELSDALSKTKSVILKERENYEEKLKDIKSTVQLNQYLNVLVQDILNQYSSKNEVNPVEVAKSLVENNYHLNISLGQLANCVHLNPTYFCGLFKKETGMSFIEYRTLIRIKNAKRLLSDSDMTVCEISSKTGYTDPKHFYKLFKRFVGMTPSEFRDIKINR